jgi:transcription elongation GreA/GreB family factor
MNKRALIDKIIIGLQSELKTYMRAAKSSHEEATSEENRSENKYDTRGLEASYLAAGQANKVSELEAAIGAYKNLPIKAHDNASIEVGALVELDHAGEKMFYFIGPSAGGMEVIEDGHEVLVITPQSPLGSQLQGRRPGEHLNLALNSKSQEIKITNFY